MSAKSNLALDLVLAAAFLVAMNPPLSGPTVHEWLGVSFGAVLVFHTLIHWNWIACVTSRLFGSEGRGCRLNYAVDALLFISLTATVFSGIMMSRHLLPALGLSAAPGRGWREIHELGANLSLAAVGVHVGLHWSWVMSTLPRLFGRERAPAFAPAHAERPSNPSLAPDTVR